MSLQSFASNRHVGQSSGEKNISSVSCASIASEEITSPSFLYFVILELGNKGPLQFRWHGFTIQVKWLN